MAEKPGEDGTEAYDFLCFSGEGCPARVRKPGSPRPQAVRPSPEGRRLRGGFVIKSRRVRRIFGRSLCNYVRAFLPGTTGLPAALRLQSGKCEGEIG